MVGVLRASAQQVQAEEVIVYYTALLGFLLLGLGLALSWADDGLLRLYLFGLVGVLLNKVADLRLGLIIVARIHVDKLLVVLQGWRVADPDEVEHHLQNFAVILHVVLRFWELVQFVDVCLEVAEVLLVLLDEELDGVERLGLDLEGVVDF